VHKNQKQSINNKTDRKETNNNSRYQSWASWVSRTCDKVYAVESPTVECVTNEAKNLSPFCQRTWSTYNQSYPTSKKAKCSTLQYKSLGIQNH
jgi:hypothetical protein